jgi:hypothetical protein
MYHQQYVFGSKFFMEYDQQNKPKNSNKSSEPKKVFSHCKKLYQFWSSDM